MSHLSDFSADQIDLTAEFVERFHEQLQLNSEPAAEAVDPGEIESLNTELERIRDQLELAKNECRNRNAQLESRNEKIEEQARAIDELLQAPKQDRSKSAQEDTEVNNLRKENRNLRSQTQKFGSEIEALKADNAETWKANESFSKSLKKKTKEIEKLQAKLASQANVEQETGSSPDVQFETNQNGVNDLVPAEGDRDDLLSRIREEHDSISRLDRLFQQYGLDLNKIPDDRLGELTALFEHEHEIKKIRHAHVMRTRHR